MINGITPTMAKKILSSAADGIIPAKRNGEKIIVSGYTMTKDCFLRFKGRLDPSYRIQFV